MSYIECLRGGYSMSKVIRYLDAQSDIQLIQDEELLYKNITTTDILFLLEGGAELKVDGQIFMMESNDIVVVNKYESYQLKIKRGSLLFHFSISDLLMSQALELEQVSFNCNSVEDPNKEYDILRNIMVSIIELLLFENERTNFIHLSKIYQLLNELTSLFLVNKIYHLFIERYFFGSSFDSFHRSLVSLLHDEASGLKSRLLCPRHQ